MLPLLVALSRANGNTGLVDGEKRARTFVVGDVHLTRHSPPDVADALGRLLERHPGERLVFAGDCLDLATDAPNTACREAVRDVFGVHDTLRRKLAEFLDAGGEVALLGGNHDAALGAPEAVQHVAAAVGVVGAAQKRIVTRPWFLREGGVHLEHGHVYDPDNAPAHPLVDGVAGLGVHFSAKFIHPTQAYRFMHANDAMPLELLITAFRWYGPRAPEVIARYFETAFTALAQAGPFYRGAADRTLGMERHARYAEDAGVPASVVEAVFAIGGPSTFESWPRTFARLYLDRVAATLAIAAGLGALAVSGTRQNAKGWATLGLGGALMAGSWLAGGDRYGGTVVARLAAAAERIADESDAKLVVFGHAHREALGERYANTGSFTWPVDAPGRPYLEIVPGDRPRAVRHYLA